ncbi:MAG TPA: alpha-2-macroglobulin family protein [Candidatus Acidoferrum sp.]|nr:alpha-2-macroglobulin family protein [Candidatus Acidoferrum sp.]
MRWKSILFLACFFTLILPAGGQRPGAYFSLSTNKTYLPGEKIALHVFASNVQGLEFRLYKVNDPALFFERLDSPHGFGASMPKEQVDNLSFLERFHDWKQDQWISIRDFFRYQFSARTRSRLREEQQAKAKAQAKSQGVEVFAQAPVLNSSQLVARWHQAMPPRFYSETESVPVQALGKGVYLVEATDGQLRAYTILIVSELGLVTKTTEGQVLTFAADRRTGAPISGADVRIWADQKEKAHLKSDADGLAHTAIPRAQYQDVRVLAVHDNDVALVTPYSYNLSSNPAQDWSGYVYTDRPVYRPTHTVHFKAILRMRDGERFQVPAGEQVQVLIEDPDSKPVLQSTLPISAYGTVHGDLDLSAAAALGYYSISINGPGGQRYPINSGFYVEEYKKPEYEVKVTPTTSRVLQGNFIEATIEAKYYFGEPVAGADVKYVVHTSPFWTPFIDRDEDDASGGFASEGDADDSEDYAGAQISEQSGKLGADGKLSVRIPTSLDPNLNDARYRIEARVTDAANREIAGHNSVVATYGSFAVGVSAESYVFQVGDTIHATAVAKDYDGKPVQTAVHVELVRGYWYYNYGSNQRETVVDSADAVTGPDGTAVVTFQAKQAGSLFLRVKAQTPEKRQVQGSTYLWVTSTGNDWWGGENRSIRMVADKKSYKVGDTAHVLVLTGVPDAYLLVTTEARTIQSQRVVHATTSSITIDVPIASDQQPNVFFSVAFIHDNKLFTANKSLKVPATQQKLQIEIQPSQKQFQPGQKASYTLLVHDSNGKPVSGELSIGVVDEAIYAIRPDTSGDPHDYFYGPVYDSVYLSSSLNFYFSGEAGKRQMFLTYRGASKDRALAQLKPEQPLVQPKVRKLFPDTALWLADVHTDSNGRAEAQLTFPDTLTTWRATVRGVTLDTKVGSAINDVIVRKNVMVRLAVPRFFRQGDEVTISAIVHNYLASAKTVQVSLELKGLEVLSGQTSSVEVPSKGEAKVDWRVRAQTVHEADLLVKALTNEESDAMEITLPVIPYGVKLNDARSGSIAGSDQDDKTTITLPGNPAQSAPGLDISLSPSLAGSLFSALDYLTSYPYGCTEQTMSSFLPDIVVAKAMKDLKLQSTVDSPELEKKIQAGMARLKDFQHDDGGWGWWKEDESQVFMTAYVVSGFGQAREAGYDPGGDLLPRGLAYLHTALSRHPDMRYDLRAYVVYALALNHSAKPQEVSDAWDVRGHMNTQGLAMLGLTLLSTGDQAKAQEIASTVESQASVTSLEASWPSNYDYMMEFEIDDAAETTAYAVRLLSLIKPDSPLLPKAALWLVNHREDGFFWYSTKQTAMVIFGLTEYVKSSHELEANFHAEVFVNGKQVLAKQFTQSDAWNPVPPSVHLDASQLQTGANEIRIHKFGSGRLYWSASGSYYSNEKRFIQSNKLSLNITRDYFRLAPEQLNGRIVYNLDPLQGDLHIGDILAVRVTVAGSEWRYLLVEDPIPAGAEFITRDDLYELKQRPPWWEYWFTRREFHDDRAAIFQTYFTGRHEYVYLLKIVNPGKFLVSPAMVQPMYQPSVMATSDAAVVEVK